MDELKPCAFCGNLEEIAVHDDLCENCFQRMLEEMTYIDRRQQLEMDQLRESGE